MSFLSGRNGCLELMLSTVKALNDYCPPVQVDNEEWYLWWEDLPVHSIFLPASQQSAVTEYNTLEASYCGNLKCLLLRLK